MKYTIDYGFGKAILYTPHDPEERFYALASTCFGIRKSIAGCSVIKAEEAACADYERLEFSGDVYVWREDGARKMLEPYPDEEWDTEYCTECGAGNNKKMEEKNMKQYIGTKLIEAEAMTRGDYNEYRGWQLPAGEDPEDAGYLVKYSDNYVSWSPAWVFESAYLPLTINEQLRTKAPSISQQMVNDFIVAAETVTMGTKCTVVRAVLRNGFEIVESSACVSAENYDEKLGREICMKKIEDKVWFLLGFLLQTAVNGVSGCEGLEKTQKDYSETCEQKRVANLTFGQAISAAKRGCRIAREGWNGKNQFVELAKNIVYEAPDGRLVSTCHEAIGKQAFAFHGTSGVQMGWLASQADMLAEDWKIVE